MPEATAHLWQFRPPIITRYLEKQYVDEFFDTGRLRLSSFAQFAQHRDEQRLDASEGHAILTGIGPQQITFAVVRVGHEALVLCGSTREDQETMTAFGADSYFRITDTPRFAAAIATKLPGFDGGVEGNCIYTDSRVLRRHIPTDPKDIPQNPDGSLPMSGMRSVIGSIAGVEVYLLKHRSFSHQAEYRLIWRTRGEAPNVLFVECPEARKFCDRGGAHPVILR
jgi:hypothetical protein